MQQTIIKFKFKFKSNDFYISNKNELAYKFIKSWPDWPTKIAYIYGSEKCGKTSICKLWMKLSKSIYVNKNNFLRRLIPQDNLDFIKSRNWIIDDVDHIIHFKKNKYEEKILNLINIIKASDKNFLLMTSKNTPKSLKSRLDDLISRLSSSTVIEMQDPDEDLLKKIIEKYLSERNVNISNENLEYLINRIERSYKSALMIAEKIDVKSMEAKKKINKLFLNSIIN